MPTRRQFIRQSVFAAAATSLTGCGPASPATESGPPSAPDSSAVTTDPTPYVDDLGIQLWTVREALAADERATLEALAEIGYRQVEGMDTTQAARLRPLCDELGLRINSSFMAWPAITGRWDLVPDMQRIEFSAVLDEAAAAGCQHLVFGYLNPGERETADDWKRLADQLNEAALTAQRYDIAMAYHNHNFEWDPVEGTTGWAILNERLDGSIFPFELDVFWAQIAGQDARATLESIRDRVSLLHLKQLKPGTPVVTRLADVPPDAFEELPDGGIPITELMALGRSYGVRHCMVEQDGNWEPDAVAAARRSYAFLRG